MNINVQDCENEWLWLVCLHELPTKVVPLWYLQIVAHFTASWCVPSVFMNSFFEDLASSYKDALFLIVDVDEVKVKLLYVSLVFVSLFMAPLL